ncbi:hypothetical protein QVG61_08505 [Thiohalobacter sp. IOR34]|uniref:hypothetical protein n=1 Tax=Thiohalobacter sp. IOR34 TaxID=3057176 RepID=UPI0025AF48A0|nr:hypothetical protein [Thiohalobacter sp. IOR34]WJW74547.1 hypothetical protein QVG61_08505 [Thiohalobacter sp. IOR34]
MSERIEARGEVLWYTRRQGQVRGPFVLEELQRHMLLGRLREEDELSSDQRCWRPLRLRPELLPAVMRTAAGPLGRQRLLAARARVDERSGRERRLPARRMVVAGGVERRGRDRRRPESPALVRYRRLYRLLQAPTGQRLWRPLLLAVLTLGALGWLLPG